MTGRLLSAAMVIARRDYVATVFSRLFLLFLIGPVIIFATVGLITVLGGKGSKGPIAPSQVIVTLDVGDARLLDSVRARLTSRLGEGALPAFVEAHAPTEAPSDLLRRDRTVAAVLSGSMDRPVVTVISGAPEDIVDDIGLVIDMARSEKLMRSALPPVSIVRHEIVVPKRPGESDRADLARGSQIALFFFILLLAGMLLSNFIEEKSNKVIEVLAAAVPLDAIFLGKLMGMLAISLTSITVWGGGAVAGVFLLYRDAITGMTEPAVGWPIFCILGAIYFVTTYSLVGAVLLGIGSQAASPREVQTLSLPVTMGQALLLTIATMGVSNPHGWVAKATAIFPWSSPLAMIARAAELPALWPHAVAVLWQVAWLVLALRVAARRFRSAVLKSGGARA